MHIEIVMSNHKIVNCFVFHRKLNNISYLDKKLRLVKIQNFLKNVPKIFNNNEKAEFCKK